MNEKDNLFQEGSSDTNKLRKLLIMGGVAFVVFIVVVVIYKFISGDDTSKTKVILPPEIKKETTLFKDVTISDMDKNTPVEENQPKKIVTEENITKPKKEEVKEVKVETPIKVEEATPKIIEKPKEITHKKVQKEVVKPKSRKVSTHKKSVVIKRYYIQVAALTKNSPSHKFLSIIKKEGFEYKILKTDIKINGRILKVKKVLVGPYKTYKEAKKHLNKVKQKISSGAFVLKV